MTLKGPGWIETMRSEQAVWTGARILVVENDTALAGVIRERLCQDNFSVEIATTTAQAWAACARLVPDVILLDLDLDRADAREFTRILRSGTHVPIIVLSVTNVERQKVAALEVGADDCMTKPLGLEELLARIRAALRHSTRASLTSEAVVRIGDLEIDLGRRRITLGGRQVHLTPTEYDLLKLLAAYPDKILTDRMLLDEIWGSTKKAREHTLHVYIARLRQKLEISPDAPRYLLTESSAGYRLATEPVGVRPRFERRVQIVDSCSSNPSIDVPLQIDDLEAFHLGG